MNGRRELTFARLDEVMPDVDRLLEGHTTVGRWSLGQICNHLSSALLGSIEGFPGKAPWLVRKALAPAIKRRILKTGRMAEGVKLPDAFVPKPGLDPRTEVEALRAALLRYSEHSGRLALHPLFDRLTRDEWTLLHCIHCAHHLSFVWGRRGTGDPSVAGP